MADLAELIMNSGNTFRSNVAQAGANAESAARLKMAQEENRREGIKLEDYLKTSDLARRTGEFELSEKGKAAEREATRFTEEMETTQLEQRSRDIANEAASMENFRNASEMAVKFFDPLMQSMLGVWKQASMKNDEKGMADAKKGLLSILKDPSMRAISSASQLFFDVSSTSPNEWEISFGNPDVITGMASIVDERKAQIQKYKDEQAQIALDEAVKETTALTRAEVEGKPSAYDIALGETRGKLDAELQVRNELGGMLPGEKPEEPTPAEIGSYAGAVSTSVQSIMNLLSKRDRAVVSDTDFANLAKNTTSEQFRKEYKAFIDAVGYATEDKEKKILEIYNSTTFASGSPFPAIIMALYDDSKGGGSHMNNADSKRIANKLRSDYKMQQSSEARKQLEAQ